MWLAWLSIKITRVRFVAVAAEMMVVLLLLLLLIVIMVTVFFIRARSFLLVFASLSGQNFRL